MVNCFFMLSLCSVMPHEHRKRSLSDSTSLKSSSVYSAEQLRKTKSYTTFPHIDTQPQHTCTSFSPSIHRTSCFRLMPHLSEDSFPDPNYPTISVLSLCTQYENYPVSVAFEISSESEEDSDKEQSSKLEERVLHSWRRPSCRPRSFSEPIHTVETARRARTWSLPDVEEKSSRDNETMHKVKLSRSRLQFPERPLENLKEEVSSCSQGQSSESVKVGSSSVMSVVDNCEENFGDESFSFQEVSGGEEMIGHWINRTRKQPITKPPSFSSLTEIDEGNIEELENKVIISMYSCDRD